MRKCHWCIQTTNLKAAYCEGNTCFKDMIHNTSVCKNCYMTLDDIDEDSIKNWDLTDYNYEPKKGLIKNG
jgi:hypothetical protein